MRGEDLQLEAIPIEVGKLHARKVVSMITYFSLGSIVVLLDGCIR